MIRASGFLKRPKGSTAKRRAKKRRQSEAEKKRVYALVDARDGYWCRCCGASVPLHRHHIQFRSQLGKHTTANVVSLCRLCHEHAHARQLYIAGNADEALTFSWTTVESCPMPR